MITQVESLVVLRAAIQRTEAVTTGQSYYLGRTDECEHKHCSPVSAEPPT